MGELHPDQNRDLSRVREEEISRHLHGLDVESFEQLLDNPGFRHRHLVTVLRDAALPAEVIRKIFDDEELISDYRVKAAMAQHHHTPKIIALQLLRHLFWRDLLQVIDSLRVDPHVRRTAEHLLGEQLETLTLGEKMTLARLAGRSVIRLLRTEQDPRVLDVLLQNSRVTEEDVLFMTTRSSAKPATLRTIGRSTRWARRYPVRMALVRNSSTPPGVSLGLLSGLKENDLQALTNIPSVPMVVRRTAERILSEGRKRR